jgi:KaiC/GvpD/RAD55 family RecA-like ATPase
MYEINEGQIRKWWQLFNPQGKLVEIRLLGKAAYSGYFRDIDTLIAQLRPLLDHNNYQYYGAMQAYFTLNEINDALYSREQHDTFVKKPKSTTNDGDITRRRMVLIDLDPSRAAGISASDDEFEKAHLKAVDVFRYLIGAGFKEPIITKSGNGWHVYLPCDMPNDEEHNELVKRFLQSLSKMFSDASVEIDEKVFNPARIDKLIGTWAKKGSDTPDRKWRIAEIVKVPADLSPNDDALFQKIADLLPKEEPKVAPNRRPQYQGNNTPFDLVTWLNEHGIKYREKKSGTSTLYELEYCPWVDTHSDRKKWDSALFVDNDGKITFNCTHSHCKDKTWHDVRLFYEPTAYDRPAYQPQYAPRIYAPQKPRYQIKEELPELGKKWLCMSDIQKVDLSSIPRIKTGINEIDRLLLGLAECEVTLLSGGNASGKSSLLNTLICNFLQQGAPSALFSGELPAHILKAWIQMVAAGKENLKLSQYGDGKYFVPNNIAKRIDDWMDGKFFLFNNEYGNTWEEVFHDMKELLKAGVKVFILDNLMALDIDLLEGDKNNKQKNLILQLKDFAKTNNVHIIIVAHPRKSLAFLRKADISGTADLTNAVDNVFIAHRVNQDFLKAGAEFYGQSQIQRYSCFGNVVEISKNRMYGICDVLVGLHYELESRRFKNTPDENIHYGWEAEPVQGTMSFNENERAEVYTEQSDAPYAVGDMPFAPPIDSDVPF